MRGSRLLAGLLALVAAPDAPPSRPLYDLRAGDRVSYRIALVREVRTPRGETRTRFAWDSQVLVTADQAGVKRVGFVRRRTAAGVERHREDGKDRLAEERARFAERLRARPEVFAEGNAIGADGWGFLPWSAVREAGGEFVPSIRELPALPLGPGATWRGDDDLGVVFRLGGTEARDGVPCVRVDGEDEGKGLSSGRPGASIRYWHDAATGLVRGVEAESRYLAPPEQEIHERVEIDLVERRRGEDVRAWLADATLRRGALAALLVSDVLPPGVGAADVSAVLADPEPAAQRQALALLYRFGLPGPPSARLAELAASTDAGVRALAARFAAPPRPPDDARDIALARTVREGGVVADWRCGEDAGWAARAVRAQRRPGHAAGDLRRRMTTPGFEGRRWAVHVPDEYRGDEPFPLIVALAGGPGRSTQVAQASADVVRGQGSLVVYPEAHGYWWDAPAIAAVPALLREALDLFDVDPNRVSLTGFSNGGTGTFLYATLWPDRLAAAAPLMGAGVGLFERDPPAAANVGRLPMLFLHGADDAVIPSRATDDTVAAIRKATPDAPVTREILPGRGHDLFLASDGGRTLAFLAGRVRDPFPRAVTLDTRTLDFARAFWLEVAAKDDGLAHAEAALDASARTVRLTTRRVKRLRLLLRRELLAPGPLTVLVNGRAAWQGDVGEDCRLLQESWHATGDPFLAHSAAVDVDVPR